MKVMFRRRNKRMLLTPPLNTGKLVTQSDFSFIWTSDQSGKYLEKQHNDIPASHAENTQQAWQRCDGKQNTIISKLYNQTIFFDLGILWKKIMEFHLVWEHFWLFWDIESLVYCDDLHEIFFPIIVAEMGFHKKSWFKSTFFDKLTWIWY